MENQKPLYMPIKTIDAEDYIAGIGKKELAVLSLITVITIIISVILSFVLHIILGLIVGVFIVSISVMIVRRDNINENLIKKLPFFGDFQRVLSNIITPTTVA